MDFKKTMYSFPLQVCMAGTGFQPDKILESPGRCAFGMPGRTYLYYINDGGRPILIAVRTIPRLESPDCRETRESNLGISTHTLTLPCFLTVAMM